MGGGTYWSDKGPVWVVYRYPHVSCVDTLGIARYVLYHQLFAILKMEILPVNDLDIALHDFVSKDDKMAFYSCLQNNLEETRNKLVAEADNLKIEEENLIVKVGENELRKGHCVPRKMWEQQQALRTFGLHSMN
ncbi:hypothetical protein BHM03_00006182 [Ensete ventricosum]|uniref:Uncharacterized protein n=1 Tax=Ensete ventricosum TaxID=4639 RepID=A0A426YH45_ENSVE|nr:hypothetical protein B296_00009898 [Ensete ventricosum]RZR80231.1 hypothetical protein BHM03_00006182 [Ensete ventricosum]